MDEWFTEDRVRRQETESPLAGTLTSCGGSRSGGRSWSRDVSSLHASQGAFSTFGIFLLVCDDLQGEGFVHVVVLHFPLPAAEPEKVFPLSEL